MRITGSLEIVIMGAASKYAMITYFEPELRIRPKYEE